MDPDSDIDSSESNMESCSSDSAWIQPQIAPKVCYHLVYVKMKNGQVTPKVVLAG